jgi:Tfp pilus assembly protein PilE
MDKSTMQAAAAQIEDHFRQYANDSTEDIQEVKVRRGRSYLFQIRFSGTNTAKFSYRFSCFTVSATHRDLYTRLLNYKA